MLSLFLLLSLVLVSPRSSLALSFSLPSFSSLFPSHRFTSEKLLDLSSLGLPKTGLISAWGDFNRDQSNDLFYLSYDQRSLSVWNWDKKNYQWKEDPNSLIKTKSDFIVTNVVPGDYDRDGKLDVLLMGERHPGWNERRDATTDMLLYLQTSNGTFSDPIRLDPSTLSQPLILDATGSMTPSLLSFTPDSPLSPSIWLNSPSPSSSAPSNSSSPFTSRPIDASIRFDYSSHPSSTWSCQFPTQQPHSNQFLDLDGDCLADIFLTCIDEERGKGELRYEVWVNEKGGEEEEEGKGKGGMFRWKRGGQLPKGTRSVSFADMDRDGTLDMILTVCPNGPSNNKDCTLQIAYNDQIPLCTAGGGGGGHEEEGECRDLEDLCVADPNFGFNLEDSKENDSLSKFSVSSTLVPSHNLVTSSTSFRGHLPTPPSAGDYNIDGYPDLLLLVSPQAHPSQRLAKLLQSRACVSGKCTQGEIRKGRRWFELVEGEGKGVEELEKFKDVESVSWVDLDDDGSLDIAVQRTGQSGAARSVHFIKNNFFNDAFFLKAMVLNGACQNWCEPKEPGESRYRPYGSSYSGASFKFTVLDPTGARRSTQYAQLPYTSYLSLGLPYAHLGLGRTNNYVENLFIGSTRSNQSQHFINLEGVIPNSQVLILPYQSKEESGGDVGEWRKELYLKPGDWIPWVTVVLLTAILGLGIVVLVLHLNEKREDEVERRARLLSLNFGAL